MEVIDSAVEVYEVVCASRAGRGRARKDAVVLELESRPGERRSCGKSISNMESQGTPVSCSRSMSAGPAMEAGPAGAAGSCMSKRPVAGMIRPRPSSHVPA